MKLKFKLQPYQSAAVAAVVDCFAGQVKTSGVSYRIDPGVPASQSNQLPLELPLPDCRNAPLQLSEQQLLQNIRTVQQHQNLPLSEELVSSAAGKLNLDIEMETGTGKTYCYIKTLFELNQQYGWNKFIIVVPSIAIREGVLQTLALTADHFAASYNGKKARFFAYNSKQLHELESYAADAGINVMVINIQAFNATGKDNRRIYEELDDFQSRQPIAVISANQPILILDEPQKMEGKKTLQALAQFNPLLLLRYSATHRTTHNKIHRLDALDAYNQKLVKKIAVRGISIKGLSGSSPYLYLESIEISSKAPLARLELEVRQRKTIKRLTKRLTSGSNLYELSNGLDAYRGFTISQIDARTDTIEFSNGQILQVGEVMGDVTEASLRRIQIRETIKAHLEKEQELLPQGIKVLSLFFIDVVKKYRDYSQEDEQGEYARMFSEEYQQLQAECLQDAAIDPAYRAYLANIPVAATHNGYFSIDKKTKQLSDSPVKKRGENAGLSDDVDAYDLILKDKERLLDLAEPVRFIFSHSALREGWDNPNVFVMCMLKHSDNTISRRQEVGRGLRISVNQQGERMDHPATVHEINVLTVVANESYQDFVANLQQEISAAVVRPRQANEAYFIGKSLVTADSTSIVTEEQAKQIYRYLIKHDYTDDTDQITASYHAAKIDGNLAALPESLAPYKTAVFDLIDGVFTDAQLPLVGDDRKPKRNRLNANFAKKEFQALWQRINQQAIYRVKFDPKELIDNSIKALNSELRVTPLTYTIQQGEQKAQVSHQQLQATQGFKVREQSSEYLPAMQTTVKYDLLGKIASNTMLTRNTVAAILSGIKPDIFTQFQQNPEHFISECARLLNEQKATLIIEKLTYDSVAARHEIDIFTVAQTRQEFSNASQRLNKHIYDYAITDSKLEQDFVAELDTSREVVVYAKLPRGFFIPTPVGDYNPDWAIAFQEGKVKHIYFVAETKGSLSSMELRPIEQTKIACARKFFTAISSGMDTNQVQYDVVNDYGKLLQLVGIS